MDMILVFIYGLVLGHVGAGYALHGDYPKPFKAVVLMLFAAGYVWQSLRAAGALS